MSEHIGSAGGFNHAILGLKKKHTKSTLKQTGPNALLRPKFMISKLRIVYYGFNLGPFFFHSVWPNSLSPSSRLILTQLLDWALFSYQWKHFLSCEMRRKTFVLPSSEVIMRLSWRLRQ